MLYPDILAVYIYISWQDKLEDICQRTVFMNKLMRLEAGFCQIDAKQNIKNQN